MTLFFDSKSDNRLRPYVEQFLKVLKVRTGDETPRLSLWFDNPEDLTSFDLEGLTVHNNWGNKGDPYLWNGLNIQPYKSRFSLRRRNVIPAYNEDHATASASFALLDQPFDEDDPGSFRQHFVVTVARATQYGEARDDLTFNTPFVPCLNEFYGRYFYFIYDEARSEPDTLSGGAVGIFETVGTSNLRISAFRVHDFIAAFFSADRNIGQAIRSSGANLLAYDSSIGWPSRMPSIEGSRRSKIDRGPRSGSELH